MSDPAMTADAIRALNDIALTQAAAQSSSSRGDGTMNAAIRQIDGLPGWYIEVLARYDYATAPGRCPVCGGVGLPWAGWFSCDGRCHGVALVATGQMFVPVQGPPAEERTP